MDILQGKIARIISPSGVIAPEYLEGAAAMLRSQGYTVSEGKHARAVSGRFAGTDEERLLDLQEALDDPTLDLILCSRGGYGLVRLIDKLRFDGFAAHPKWVVGFSDTTVLHAALNRQGFPSVHGHMARYLSELPAEDATVEDLFNIVNKCIFPVYQLPFSKDSSQYNRPGSAEGILVGGNLSVLMGMRGTPCEPIYKGSILLIEDIAEQPYHIDRMMRNLRLSGVLAELAGLIIGHFTDCPEDESMGLTIPEIIHEAVEGYQYPVCFGFPAGHEHPNFPVVLGQKTKLTVGEQEAIVDQRTN